MKALDHITVTVKLDGKARALKGVASGFLILLDDLTPAQRQDNEALISGIKANILKLYKGLATEPIGGTDEH
jgi:hypothetical protein